MDLKPKRICKQKIVSRQNDDQRKKF